MSNFVDQPASKTSMLRRFFRALPTLITFALLGAAGYAGHHTGWRLPTIGANHARGEAEPEWCSEHNVPEAECVECRPELMPKSKPQWCKLHGVTDCPTCQPEFAQTTAAPKLPQYDTAAALLQFSRPQNNSRCQKFTRRVQFASLKAFDASGIDVDVVTERPMTESLKINGEVGYDQTQVAHLASRVPGTVFRVFRRLGDSVKAGDVLALVDSLEVGKAKTALSKALIHFDHTTRTLASIRKNVDVIPRQQLRELEHDNEEAELEVITAQQALINLGFDVPEGLEKLDARELTRRLQCLGLPDGLCEDLLRRGGLTMNLIPLRVPQAGMIVEMDLVAGEVVSPERRMVTIADLSHTWLTLHVRQEDAKLVSVGQAVRFQPDGSELLVEGTVDWVSPAVDEVTRTVPVRATLTNVDHKLKANSFGTGWIVLREEPKAITVPVESLQSDGDCFIVFVRDKNFLRDGSLKVFHARQVRPAARNETHVELLAGVLPGEVVASKGSAALRAELLKNAFGEGCCGGHGHQH